MKLCRKCKTEWKGLTQPGAKESCVKCGEDLHACVNCGLYDEQKPNQCREGDGDPVQNKERYNFCEYFQFIETANPSFLAKDRSSAKETLYKLFKK